MEKRLTAIDIANAFADLSLRDDIAISKTKLHKLVFFTYEKCILGKDNEITPLFDDEVRAEKNGFYYPSINAEIKGKFPDINGDGTGIVDKMLIAPDKAKILPHEVEQKIRKVWHDYKHKSDDYVINYSHTYDIWKAHAEDRSVITPQEIAKYRKKYDEVMEQTKLDIEKTFKAFGDVI